MQKIVPNLWFDQNIDQAANFYASVLPNAHVQKGFSHPDTGEAITTDVVIEDYRITLINGGPYATPNPSISFFLNFDPSQRQDAEADLKRVWNALTADGEILMELGEYPFSKLYGWVTDRFGFNWQLMLSNPDNEPRPFIVPSLMFCGAAQGKATEAVDYYTELFDVAALANRVTYETMGVAGDKNSPDAIPQPSHVAFSDFHIFNHWFAAADSGVAQDITFTPAVSFMLFVQDQRELDHYWNALSASPEAEQCGWLEDKFGLSWQIAPQNLPDLLSKPHGFENMLKMKKLVIDEF
ncbi:VOC family protein [Corynebacterium sp. J010B-136]|uniref:VOC family protein n=1 Tax=Corynebacterium sp. J010B-136 TaxID=2099401 RepID=UPI000CFA6DB2|nr:VOC family protein [Corynebacterium sp. J010B-136]PQM73846.1 hypothetical protein C5Y44_10240 [Corynebacterium sp. J010B-136]